MEKNLGKSHIIAISAYFDLNAVNEDDQEKIYSFLNIAYMAGIDAMSKEHLSIGLEYGYPDWLGLLTDRNKQEK